MPQKLTIFPVYLSGYWNFIERSPASGGFNRLVLFSVALRKLKKRKKKAIRSLSGARVGLAVGRTARLPAYFILQKRKSNQMVSGNCDFSTMIFLERVRRPNWRRFRLNILDNLISFSRRPSFHYDGRFSLAIVFRQQMSIVSKSEASKDCILQALLLGFTRRNAREAVASFPSRLRGCI